MMKRNTGNKDTRGSQRAPLLGRDNESFEVLDSDNGTEIPEDPDRVTISGMVNGDPGRGEYNGPNTHGSDQQDLVPKDQRTRNIITALSLHALVMIGSHIYSDASHQYVYQRFTKQVLGANFSKLNISATKHPCLHQDNSSAHNPFKHQLNEAQMLTSQFQQWSLLLAFIPTLISGVLVGAYADCIGRRFFFILTTIGIFFQTFVTWVVCFWDLNIYILFGTFLIRGATGSDNMLHMALYVYTVDNTSANKSRAVELVFVASVANAVASLSHMAVGYMIAYLGFMWPFAIANMIVFVGLVCFVFFLRESLPKDRRPNHLSLLQGMKSLVSFYYKKDEEGDIRSTRTERIMLLVVLIIISSGHRPQSIQTLYLLNEPFCWNSKIIGNMKTIVSVVGAVVSVVFIKLVKRCVSDEMVLLFKLAFAVASNLFFAFAATNWVIYIALAFGIIGESVFSLIRAIMSRMVPPTRAGTLFSSLALSHLIFIQISNISMHAAYAQTVKIWRGLIFFIGGLILSSSAIFVIMYVIVSRRRISTQNNRM